MLKKHDNHTKVEFEHLWKKWVWTLVKEMSLNNVPYDQSWAYCSEERKSASLFLLRRNAILGFQKHNCALCALKF